MASTKDDDARGPTGIHKCAECGTRFGGDQRYCLNCGARRGPLPAAIGDQISNLQRRSLGLEEAEPVAGAAAGAAGSAARGPDAEAAGGAPAERPEADAERWPAGWTMPSPRAAAIAVLGMLALGILLGSATSQVAQSAGISAILFESPAAAPPAEEPEEEAIAEAPEEEEAAPEEEATVSEAPVEEAPVEEIPEEEGEAPPPPEEEVFEEETLPPVKHVFVILLGENGYEETFGATSPAPYLSKTLPEQGELLPNYYAVAGGVLANEIALISGQGPTAETSVNCPNYVDVTPGTESTEGQVEGNGCVYPASAETLAGQLTAKKLKWKAYFEDMEKGALTGQPTSCRHPALGTPDLNQAPVGEDGYLTWRDPFVYFHSIIDGSECASNVVGLEALTPDLANVKKTPTLSYIVPNACHSGGSVPCAEGKPTGAVAAEEFLRKVVPAIQASAAYKEGGLIAITSAEAPQAGEHADSSACCAYPEYPNVPPAEVVEGTVPGTRAKGGGGRVGMLLLSPFVKAGSVEEVSNYNHFTFLVTIEELLELERIGYAKEAALLPFESSVFNYAEEEESTSAQEPSAAE